MTEIQEIILNIFKEVSKLCEENDVPYFAIGGTCLGAVRHQGFIPWDDDMDIAIPIEEFDRFITLAKTKLPHHLVVYQPGDSRHYHSNFIKVMDANTMMTEDSASLWKDSYEGVWLDIMPISAVPSVMREQKGFISKVKWHLRSGFKMKSAFEQQETFAGKVLWTLYRPLYWVLPKDYHWRVWLNFLKKYPFNQGEYTGYVWAEELADLIFPTAWFSDYVNMKFEDTTIRCPVGWNDFLTSLFGDYMKFPPEAQRNSGHLFELGYIDLEHSYLDYQSGKYKITAEKQKNL